MFQDGQDKTNYFYKYTSDYIKKIEMADLCKLH